MTDEEATRRCDDLNRKAIPGVEWTCERRPHGTVIVLWIAGNRSLCTPICLGETR